MGNRELKLTVDGWNVRKSAGTAGVTGEGNATALVISFDESWDGLAKKITFWDALGKNPVARTLTADLLVDLVADTRTYRVPIPPEPLVLEGNCNLAIDGYAEEVRARSVAVTLSVKYSPMADAAGEPADPTPTQAEQLQVQIDALLGDISGQAQIAQTAASSVQGALDDAEQYAGQATSSASSALASANEAALRATQANTARVAAESVVETVQEAKAAAQSARDEAVSSSAAAQVARSAAEASEADAKSSETAAAESAGLAGSAALTAGNASTVAAQKAHEAEQSASDAATSAVSALESKNMAGIYAGTAKTEADRAKAEADRATEIVGGDYATREQAQGYVNNHDADLDAHSGLFAALEADATAKADAAEAAAKAASRPLEWTPTAADGVAELGADGILKETQRPPAISLGETSETAYRGDRGKTAYDHVSDTVKHITAGERSAWNGKVNNKEFLTEVEANDFAFTASYSGFVGPDVAETMGLPTKYYHILGLHYSVSGFGAQIAMSLSLHEGAVEMLIRSSNEAAWGPWRRMLTVGEVNPGWILLWSVGLAGSGTWTAPDLNNGKPYRIGVLLIPGGGGGSAVIGTSGGYAMGGATGKLKVLYLVVTPGQQVPYVVGAGGAGGVRSTNGGPTNGVAGGATSFAGQATPGGPGGWDGAWYNGISSFVQNIGQPSAVPILYSGVVPFGGTAVEIARTGGNNDNPIYFSDALSCYNPFTSQKMLSAGGSAWGSGVTNAGPGGGAARTNSAGPVKGDDATVLGCGGGAASINGSSGTATGGNGYNGGILIYVERYST